jgi:hypothetical protein
LRNRIFAQAESIYLFQKAGLNIRQWSERVKASIILNSLFGLLLVGGCFYEKKDYCANPGPGERA